MSLLDVWSDDFVLITTTETADGYGGFERTLTTGDTFKAAAVFDTSIEARVAAVQGVTDRYTITTSRDVVLNYHDIIQRVSDGVMFRITSNGTDKKTPSSTGLDMRQVTAEVWDG